jgi:hypothetical protein
VLTVGAQSIEGQFVMGHLKPPGHRHPFDQTDGARRGELKDTVALPTIKVMVMSAFFDFIAGALARKTHRAHFAFVG